MRRFLTPFAFASVMSARLDGQVAQPVGFSPHRAIAPLAAGPALPPHFGPTPVVADACWQGMGHWIGFGMLGGMVAGGTMAVVDVARSDQRLTAPLTVFAGMILRGLGGGILGGTAYFVTHGKPRRSNPRCVSPNVSSGSANVDADDVWTIPIGSSLLKSP
jgi:hypothetical protein